MTKKLWGGRFSKETDALMDDFHSSIRFDSRLYHQDIMGSIAHARMLGKQGVLTAQEAESIVMGLYAVLQKIEDGAVEFSVSAEDIHMNVEQLLTREIGEDGKRLHTGRSRNDQVALDFTMYVKQAAGDVVALLKALEEVLLFQAQHHVRNIMPGYTHMQRAQPITLGHHLMAYAQMFYRDMVRFSSAQAAADEIGRAHV